MNWRGSGRTEHLTNVRDSAGIHLEGAMKFLCQDSRSQPRFEPHATQMLLTQLQPELNLLRVEILWILFDIYQYSKFQNWEAEVYGSGGHTYRVLQSMSSPRVNSNITATDTPMITPTRTIPSLISTTRFDATDAPQSSSSSSSATRFMRPWFIPAVCT